MANVFVNQISVPKKFRNKRIYGGNSFAVTNAYEQGEAGGAQRHFEAGVIKDFDGYSTFVFFSEEFINTPIIVQFKLFRIVEIATDVFVNQDVLHNHPTNPWVTESGFIFDIDSEESLDGVELHYCFTE